MKIINVLEHRLGGERRVLKNIEGTGAKGASGTKKGMYESTQRAYSKLAVH